MSTLYFPKAINAGVVISHPTMKLSMSAEYRVLVITINIVVDAIDFPVSIQSLPKMEMDAPIAAKIVPMNPMKSMLLKLKTHTDHISKVGSHLNVQCTTVSCTTLNILVFIHTAQTQTEILTFT